MNEDEKLNGAVKAALEEGVAVGPGVLAAIGAAAAREAKLRRVRRMMCRWAPLSLVAASFALAVAIGTTLRAQGNGEVAEAIGLLRELDGEPAVEPGLSQGEALLAWQEAPCSEDVL